MATKWASHTPCQPWTISCLGDYRLLFDDFDPSNHDTYKHPGFDFKFILTMNPITPLPPFAPIAPPPAPRILSLRATDLLAHLSRRLIANEDLPLKLSHFHPYKSKLLFIFRSLFGKLKTIHSTPGGPSLRPIHKGPVPSTSAKINVSRTASSLSPLTSPCPTPDRDRSTSPTPDQPTFPTPDQPTSPTPDQPTSTTSDHGNVEGPRRNPYRTINSAGVAPRLGVVFEPIMKVGLERPKGAGRANLPRLLGWDDALHDAVKVRDFFSFAISNSNLDLRLLHENPLSNT